MSRKISSPEKPRSGDDERLLNYASRYLRVTCRPNEHVAVTLEQVIGFAKLLRSGCHQDLKWLIISTMNSTPSDEDGRTALPADRESPAEQQPERNGKGVLCEKQLKECQSESGSSGMSLYRNTDAGFGAEERLADMEFSEREGVGTLLLQPIECPTSCQEKRFQMDCTWITFAVYRRA